MEIVKCTEEDYETLAGIWECSVMTTHDFLKEEDFFEIPANKSLYNENLYYNICTELDSILGIIEYLHIDQKTGL